MINILLWIAGIGAAVIGLCIWAACYVGGKADDMAERARNVVERDRADHDNDE